MVAAAITAVESPPTDVMAADSPPRRGKGVSRRLRRQSPRADADWKAVDASASSGVRYFPRLFVDIRHHACKCNNGMPPGHNQRPRNTGTQFTVPGAESCPDMLSRRCSLTHLLTALISLAPLSQTHLTSLPPRPDVTAPGLTPRRANQPGWACYGHAAYVACTRGMRVLSEITPAAYCASSSRAHGLTPTRSSRHTSRHASRPCRLRPHRLHRPHRPSCY